MPGMKRGRKSCFDKPASKPGKLTEADLEKLPPTPLQIQIAITNESNGTNDFKFYLRSAAEYGLMWGLGIFLRNEDNDFSRFVKEHGLTVLLSERFEESEFKDCPGLFRIVGGFRCGGPQPPTDEKTEQATEATFTVAGGR